MRLELFVILVIATLLTIFAGYKSKLSPLLCVAGLFLLAFSGILFSTGLDLEMGTHKEIAAQGQIDANITDYNITFVNHSVESDLSIWFIVWSSFIIGIFLLLYGLYLMFE